MRVWKLVLLRHSKWIVVGSATIAATRFYYVQEMLAALILLALLFCCIAVIMLVLLIFDWVGQAMLGLIELQARNVLRYARARIAVSEWR